MSEEKQSNYQFYKSMGVCPHCHKRKPVPGKVYCRECAEYQKLHQSKYNYKHKQKPRSELSDQQKDSRRKSQKEWIKKHKVLGLCIRCNRPATHGIFCEKHWEINRKNCLMSAKSHHPSRQGLPIPERRQKNSKADIGKLISLYSAGWKLKDIANELNVSISNVNYWVRKSRDLKIKEERENSGENHSDAEELHNNG